MPELGERDAANGTRKRGPLASLFPDLGVHLDGARDTLERGFAGLHGQLEHIAGRIQAQENPESQRLQRTVATPPADGTVTFLRATLDVPAGWHWHVTHIALASYGSGPNFYLFRGAITPDGFLAIQSHGGGFNVADPNGATMNVDAEPVDFVVEERTTLILYGANNPLTAITAGNQGFCTLYGEKIRNQEE